MESTNQENNILINRCVEDELPTVSVTHNRSMLNSSDNDNTTITNSMQYNDQITNLLQEEVASDINILHHDLISDYHIQLEDALPLKFRHFNNHLLHLRRVIYNALKNCPEMSTDVFPSVSNHLLDFQKFALDNCQVFVDREQWSDVIIYVFMAWEHVYCTPKWRDHTFNVSRRETFMVLMRSCLTALKKLKVNDTITEEKYEYYVSKLKRLCLTSNDEFIRVVQKMEFNYFLK